jgi:leucyl aminopeptidase
MEVKAVSGDITELAVDAIIVNLFEGVESPSGATGAVDKALGGMITQLIAAGEIKGKRHEMTLIHTMSKIVPSRVLVAGLGKEDELSISKIREVAAEACRFLRKFNVKKAASILHGAGAGGLAPEASAQAITEGAMLGLYTFRKHQTKEAEEGDIEQLIIVSKDNKGPAALERGCRKGRIMAEATNLARDMANEPANYMTPTDMEKIALKIAGEWGLECRILERSDMEKMDKIGRAHV